MEKNPYFISRNIITNNWIRFFNYLIDYVLRYILVFLIALVVASIAQYTEAYDLLDWMQNINKLEELLIGILFALLYYNFFEIFFKGRTIGKFITGTVVVMRDGSVPDDGTIIKRSFCRFIPFDALSFFGDRGWHDSISDTYVVNKKQLDVEKESFFAFEEIGMNPEL